jgi:hypothetical protein
VELGDDTKVVLLLAAAMFLWALLLGVWKYRQMIGAPDGLAHPYVDTAHRAALLYSFALLLVARTTAGSATRPTSSIRRRPRWAFS